MNIDETLKFNLSLTRDQHTDSIRQIFGKVNYENVMGFSSHLNCRHCADSLSDECISLFEFCILSDQIKAQQQQQIHGPISHSSSSSSSSSYPEDLPSNPKINHFNVLESPYSPTLPPIPLLSDNPKSNKSPDLALEKSLYPPITLQRPNPRANYPLNKSKSLNAFSSAEEPLDPNFMKIPSLDDTYYIYEVNLGSSSIGSNLSQTNSPAITISDPFDIPLTKESISNSTSFGSVEFPNSIITPTSNSQRNPLMARRNPKIDRMISEAAGKHNKNHSPLSANDNIFTNRLRSPTIPISFSQLWAGNPSKLTRNSSEQNSNSPPPTARVYNESFVVPKSSYIATSNNNIVVSNSSVNLPSSTNQLPPPPENTTKPPIPIKNNSVSNKSLLDSSSSSNASSTQSIEDQSVFHQIPEMNSSQASFEKKGLEPTLSPSPLISPVRPASPPSKKKFLTYFPSGKLLNSTSNDLTSPIKPCGNLRLHEEEIIFKRIEIAKRMRDVGFYILNKF